MANTYLLIPDSKLSLCLLVVLGKRLESLDGLVLQDRNAELDVGLGVFMAGLVGVSDV